ncbi:MAG: carotenoid cleavage dioxygenase-like enzyme, partial [Planctomycetaceae bacterium]
GEAKDIIWSPVKPNYSYHPMNAYEDENGHVVIDIVRYERMFDKDILGPFGDNLARLDRWTINPKTRTVSEQIVDARGLEFPRIHPGLNGKPYQYGYSVAVQDYSFPSIYKHDMHSGTATQFDMGPGRHSAEPVFIPKDGATAEDEGYLMTYVYDGNTDTSDLLILDAQDLSRPALAQVQLPVRVPFGFHGNWVPDSVAGPT